LDREKLRILDHDVPHPDWFARRCPLLLVADDPACRS
jgi:hypothetical protein